MNINAAITKYENLVKQVLGKRLWGYDKSLVDDLSQETWIKLMKRGDIPDNPAFIKAAANNAATDHWRRNKNKTKAVSLSGEGTYVPDYRNIPQLPSEIKLTPILQMRADGWTYKEIAEHLGIPIGTVKSRIYKDRNNLRLS